MAINYTNLFTVLGKYVKAANTLDGFHSTLDTAYSDIEGALEAQGLNRLIKNVETIFDRYHDDIERWLGGYSALTTEILTDPEYVTNELGNINNSISEVLASIIEDMTTNGEDVNQSLYVGPSPIIVKEGVTPAQQAGPLVVSYTYLSATQTPVISGSTHPNYNGSASEVSVGHASGGAYMIVECIATGSNAADESYTIFSQYQQAGPWSRYAETPRSSATIPGVKSIDLLGTSGEMENFVNNKPVGWNFLVGTAGTDFEQYNVSLRGNYSLHIMSDGVSMQKTVSGVRPGVMYALSFKVKAVTSTKGALDDDLMAYSVTAPLSDGTTWSASGSGISWRVPALVGYDWNTWAVYFVTPVNLATDSVSVTLTFTTLFASDTNTIDEITLAPATYYNGLAWWVYPGETTEQPTVGDKTDVDTLYNVYFSTPGVFQEYFRKMYATQLPSSNVGPSIADSLAT